MKPFILSLLMLLPVLGAAQDTRVVRGVVFDGSGKPLDNVTLSVEGSDVGMQTAISR